MLLDKLLSNLSIHVKPFAICTLSEGWRLHLPGPPGLLFHFVMEGNGVLYGAQGDAHQLAPLHLSVVPIGAKHILESGGDIQDEVRIDAPPPGDVVCEIVAGSKDQADLIVSCGMVSVRYGPSLDLFDRLQEVIAVDLSNVPGARAAFQGIMEEQAQAVAGSEAMTAALMTQCLVYLFRNLPDQGMDALPWLATLQDARLGRVVDTILDDPGAEHTVERLAETAAMSRSAFSDNFVESFGRSPMSFVNHVRMQCAANLLALESLSVDEIARKVGYASRSHFSRAFKEHAGLPPNAFRAEAAAQ